MTDQRYAEAGGRKFPLVRTAEVRVLPVEEDDAAGVGTFIIPFAFRGVIDSFGSFVYPTAFSHITDAKPLTRDHEWSPTYGAGDIEVDPETEARIVGQFHATAAGQALRRELIELASKGVRLEASVGMSPVDWKIRRGGEITDQERQWAEEQGWDPTYVWAIDKAGIVEVSSVLAGAVPGTSVSVRSLPWTGAATARLETMPGAAMRMAALPLRIGGRNALDQFAAESSAPMLDAVTEDVAMMPDTAAEARDEREAELERERLLAIAGVRQ